MVPELPSDPNAELLLTSHQPEMFDKVCRLHQTWCHMHITGSTEAGDSLSLVKNVSEWESAGARRDHRTLCPPGLLECASVMACPIPAVLVSPLLSPETSLPFFVCYLTVAHYSGCASQISAGVRSRSWGRDTSTSDDRKILGCLVFSSALWPLAQDTMRCQFSQDLVWVG